MIQGIWQEFLKIIHDEVGTRIVDTWFKAVTFERWDAIQKVAYLQAPNTFVKEWLEKHYISLFEFHLGRLLHVERPKVIIINAQRAKEVVVPKKIDEPLSNIPSSPKRVVVKASSQRYGYTSRAYSFDSFVVGPSNSLAYAAARAVTEKPGKVYNTLFIYGCSGLGKTHLLHAIGNAIKMQHENLMILYQTTDRFVNEFISAIRFDKVHAFKKKYQGIDVLLIDDVQFISKKEQTQEAFFHIFNTLHEAHKQIVFSSDTYPQNMAGIAERLRSRLAWGLVTDIYQPSFETKIAILKKKAESGHEQLSDEIAHYIASQVTSNIRELEGVLVRVMAFSSLTKQPISLELVKKVIFRSASFKKKHLVGYGQVIKGISKYFSYDLKELQSKNRKRDVTFARHVAIFLLKRMTDKSLRDIGNFLGARDHTTIKYALDKMQQYIQKNPDFNAYLKKIEEHILNDNA